MLISVIIPCKNEEKYLAKCLMAINVSFSEYKKINTLANLEIIVVINRSTDNSEKIAKDFNCKIIHAEPKNLAYIRNQGIKAATGTILFTIDADSIMSKNLITKAIQTLQTGKFIGGGVMIYPERYSLGLLITGSLLIPLVLVYGITAGVFFAYKEDVLAINGFNEDWFSAEDVEFARRLRKHGRTTQKKFKNLFSAYIITSTRKFDHFGDWYFVKHPIKAIKLLFNKDPKTASEFWYDFKN